MNEIQSMVQSWILSGMDYNQGLDLLAGPLGKKIISGQYIGRQKTCAGKVAYEIIKAAGLGDIRTWKDYISQVQSMPLAKQMQTKFPDLVIVSKQNLMEHKAPAVNNDTPAIVALESIEVKPIANYPLVMRKVIHEYAALFQERSKLHTTMAEMPESNAEAVCIKRAEIFNLIKSISDRLETLHLVSIAYEKDGTLPNESELFEQENKAPVNPEFPVDEEGLKKQKKNLQSGNSKDQAILDYQGGTHDEKKPMPNGPKRIKIEARMKERTARIMEIDMMLVRPSAEDVGKE